MSLEPASERRWLALIFGLFLLLGVVTSLLIPPWEGSDEHAHYLLALNLARVGRFQSDEVNYEGIQPQLYYRGASTVLLVLETQGREWIDYIRPPPDFSRVRTAAPIYPWTAENYQFLPGLYTLRWLNLLLSAGALGLNYNAIRRFTGGNASIALTALALGALTPQYLHISSAVSNDVLGILAGAFLFWLLSLYCVRPFSRAEVALTVVVSLLLPFATKLTALLMGAALIAVVIRGSRNRWPVRWAWLVIAGLLGVGLVVLALIAFVPDTATFILRSLIWRTFFIDPALLTATHFFEQIAQLARSYWGLVGWLSVGLPDWLVGALTGLVVVGAARHLRAVLRGEFGSEGEAAGEGRLELGAGEVGTVRRRERAALRRMRSG